MHVLPGVPKLFEKLLVGLEAMLREQARIGNRLKGVGEGGDEKGEGLYRVVIKTPLAESEVAGYLGELARRVESKGVKVGSYPRWGGRGSVTLVGRERGFLEGLVGEVVSEVRGMRVDGEGEGSGSGNGSE